MRSAQRHIYGIFIHLPIYFITMLPSNIVALGLSPIHSLLHCSYMNYTIQKTHIDVSFEAHTIKIAVVVVFPHFNLARRVLPWPPHTVIDTIIMVTVDAMLIQVILIVLTVFVQMKAAVKIVARKWGWLCDGRCH